MAASTGWGERVECLDSALSQVRGGDAPLVHGWAWMNFTWFASAYDNDDVLYRVVTLVQIAGVLVLAAGVSRAFEEHEFLVVWLGYVIMRVALATQ